MSKLTRTISGAVLIVIESIVLGLGMNVLSPHPLPWVRTSPDDVRTEISVLPPVPNARGVEGSETRGQLLRAQLISLSEAKNFFDRKSAIFLDARRSEDYELEHIPGALSLFIDDLDRLYETVLGHVPKSSVLVTYCSDPQCEMAVELGDALALRGHSRVFILSGGISEWKKAGFPTIAGASR